MTYRDFKAIYNETNAIVKDKLFGAKHKEYSTKQDMFINFKQASELLETSPHKVAFYYSTKHFISIMDILKNSFEEINDVMVLNDFYSEDHINEKITDMIGYLHLIKGILSENNIRYDKE
jgi:hypothetical protein